MPVCNTRLQFNTKNTINEEMVENPFSVEVVSVSLCTRIPLKMRVVQSGSTVAHRDRDLGRWRQKEKVGGLGNDLRTNAEWRSYRSCPSFFWKVWDNTLKFLLVLCRWWVCLLVMYVCTCLCISMYCMSLRGLWAQQSLDSGIDVSSSSDEGLQVGLAVDEAHGVQLVQLGLEPNLWGLALQG